MLPFECEVFEISVKKLKIDSVNMSKNDIINKYPIKDFFFFLRFKAVKPNEEDRVLFSSRESRLLILVKADYYYICARLAYSRNDVHFSQYLIQEETI